MFHCLERRDDAVELLSLSGIGDGLVERTLSCAQCVCSQLGGGSTLKEPDATEAGRTVGQPEELLACCCWRRSFCAAGPVGMCLAEAEAEADAEAGAEAEGVPAGW